MAGEPYDGGGIGVSVAATRAATDDELARLLAGAGRRDARPGHDDRRDQERLRAHRRRRGAGAADRRASSPTETTFLGAHVVPAEYARRPGGIRRSRDRADAASAAPYARWVDVFCEPHSPHAFTADEARAVLDGRGARPASGCACTATSSVPALAYSSRSSSGPPASTTAPTSTTPTSTPSPPPRTTRSRRCCPGWSSRPARRIRTPARCSTRGSSIALATDCNPGTCYSSSMPFVIALAVREMGLTPAEALLAATAGSAKSLRRNDIGRLVVGNRARPRRARRTVLPAPGLPRWRADRTGSGRRPHRPTGQCSTANSVIGKSFGLPVARVPSCAQVVAATRQSL